MSLIRNCDVFDTYHLVDALQNFGKFQDDGRKLVLADVYQTLLDQLNILHCLGSLVPWFNWKLKQKKKDIFNTAYERKDTM